MTACPARPLPDSPYGAPELKALARAYLTRAIVSGSGLWLVLFVLLVAASPVLLRPSRPAQVPIGPIHDFFPKFDYAVKRPPGLPKTVIRPPSMRREATPVPVDRPETTRPIEPDFGPSPRTGDGAEPGTVGNLGISPPLDDAMPSPSDVVLVDEEAIPITIVKPEYPGLPRDAGVEGLVVVRVLVDRDGHVRNAFVEPKTSIPMLDEAALAAARRWMFKPAFTASHPVAVWVAIPMRFTLH
jgi:periplasmic protein TonB